MKTIHVSCIILSVLTLLNFGIIGGLSAAPSSTSCPRDMTICENGTHCTDLKSDESNLWFMRKSLPPRALLL